MVGAEWIELDEARHLGPIRVAGPPGARRVTPATRIAVAALDRHRTLLRGTGIDWGSGIGALALVAARHGAVEGVVGLEIDAEDVAWARRNARRLGLETRTRFLHADGFSPRLDSEREGLEALRGRTGFLVANPPASRGDDGLGWRRAVLRGARSFLLPGSPILLQISYQYSERRIRALADEVEGIAYEGLLASSEWVEFDQTRDDLARQLVEYAQVEAGGGLPYTFADPAAPESGRIDAREALLRYRTEGIQPLSRWQVYLYRFRP